MKLTVALLAVALATTGCGDWNWGTSDDSMYEVCVNSVTHERVDDSQCQDHTYGVDGNGSYMLWYILGQNSIPPVGQYTPGGSATLPRQYSSVTRGVPRSGYTPPRSSSGSSGSTRYVPPARPAPPPSRYK